MKKYNSIQILNNLRNIFKKRDINLLKQNSYNFLNNLSGFIAHYDINGFKSHYSDLRVLINNLNRCSDVLNPDYYLVDFFKKDKEYYESKVEILKGIKPLIEEFKQEIELSFSKGEREQDINTIKVLMAKNGLKEITI